MTMRFKPQSDRTALFGAAPRVLVRTRWLDERKAVHEHSWPGMLSPGGGGALSQRVAKLFRPERPSRPFARAYGAGKTVRIRFRHCAFRVTGDPKKTALGSCFTICNRLPC